MRNYYRIMLGRKSKFAADCFEGNFIGTGFEIKKDFTNELPDKWKEFNQKYIPVYQELFPDKSKVSAGLACGVIWTIAKGILIGDILLCPDGTGSYRIAEVTGDYCYDPSHPLLHKRPVRWLSQAIPREAMSESLRYSTGSAGTVSNISKYRDEIESLMTWEVPTKFIATESTVKNRISFALESHLEEFLIKNWSQTKLGIKYDIFEEDGELVGQQYRTDTGTLDILAISKDKSELLVIELKKGALLIKSLGKR